MSWHSIIRNGHEMYQSSDGEIVSSTQDITALDHYRAEQCRIARAKLNLQNSLRYESEPVRIEDPMTISDIIIIGIFLIILVVVLALKYCNSL